MVLYSVGIFHTCVENVMTDFLLVLHSEGVLGTPVENVVTALQVVLYSVEMFLTHL